MVVEEIFGWIGTLLTMTFFIAPVVPFYNVYNGKLNYEDAPTTLISTSYFNCLIWYIYGTLVNSQQIKVCNIIGCSSSLLFIIFYLSYEIRNYPVDAVLNALLVLAATCAGYRAFTVLFDDPNIVGKVGACSSMIVFISPLQLIYRVFKEKNYKLIPIASAIFSVLSGGCWFLYGVMKKDYYIFGSNSVGIIIGGLQVFIWNNLKRKYQVIEQENAPPTIGIEDEDAKKKEEEEMSNAKPVKIVNDSKEIV